VIVGQVQRYGQRPRPHVRAGQESGGGRFLVDSVIEAGGCARRGSSSPSWPWGRPCASLRAAADGGSPAIAGREYGPTLGRSRPSPNFHLKIDTGMHGQGFYPEEIRKSPNGSAAADGPRLKGAIRISRGQDPTYQATTRSSSKVQRAAGGLEEIGVLGKSASCTAPPAERLISTALSSRSRPRGHRALWALAVQGLELQLGDRLVFKPVLSWRSIISEIRRDKGAFVGYDHE